jgi:hypothetical protein
MSQKARKLKAPHKKAWQEVLDTLSMEREDDVCLAAVERRRAFLWAGEDAARALIKALERGCPNTAQALWPLCEQPAEANERTALHAAINGKLWDFAERALAAGAQADKPNHLGWTALGELALAAATAMDAEQREAIAKIARMMLARPDGRRAALALSARQETPLGTAARCGALWFVELLLPWSDPAQRNKGGQDAIEGAMTAGAWGCVDAIAVAMGGERAQWAFERCGAAKMPRFEALGQARALAQELVKTGGPTGGASSERRENAAGAPDSLARRL